MNYRKPAKKRTVATGRPSRAVPGAKMGRPSIYSAELGQKICEHISSGMSLRGVCELDGMPARITVIEWLWDREKHPDFADQYARACEERGRWLAEDALRIADGPVRRVKGHMDSAEVNKLRLQVDTRKWFASKLAPRQFGDRVQAELTGANGGPVSIQLAEMDWDKLIAKATGATPAEAPAAPEEASGA